MTARDVWYEVKIVRHSENDGWSYMNRGAERESAQFTWPEFIKSHPGEIDKLFLRMKAYLK